MDCSIIIPCYNCESTIHESVSSVVSSLSKDYIFEIILIDDGSKDKTYELMNRLLSQYGGEVIKIHQFQKNQGIVQALNKAIELARGRYIFRMDSDDLCLNDRFVKTINFMTKNNISVCGADVELFDGNKIIGIEKRPRSNLWCKAYNIFGPPFVHPSVCFDTKIVKKSDIKYETGFDGVEDWKLWRNLAAKGYVFGNVSEPLLKYRLQVDLNNKRIPSKNRLKLANNIFMGRFNFINMYYLRVFMLKVIKRVSI